MGKEPNLKEIERKAYMSYHQDGLLDIFAGLYVLGFGLGIFVDLILDFGMGMILMPAVFVSLALPLWIAAKRRITMPRIGFVNFGIRGANKLTAIFIGTMVAGFAFRFVEEAIFRHHGSEVKTGEAVYMQEHNSTYAMLKFYGASPLRRGLFTLANGLWMALRLLGWTLRGRTADARRLFRGWRTAHIRFARRRAHTDR